MQVINEHNWPERSLSYLCREFDQLSAGQSYESVKPAIQIGLLNFTLFPDHPEFYATYKLLNVKNHTIYSDKLQLSVLDLTQIHLATDEDKACHIDFWASLFKARTWEELHMLSQNNEYLKEASETVYHLTQEEKVRLQCQAREDYYRRMKGEYSCAMKSHFRKIGNQMSGSGNHLCEFTRVMFYLDRIPLASICHVQDQCL